MSRPTDKPMARAQAHLASGRYAEAIGAFRAVLGIDPSELSARLGMADALAARGQQGIAADGLIEAAERCAEHEQHAQALALYGKALVLAPGRMELHLDVAVVEQAMGRRDAAIARVESLAERYMSMGRTDEAAEVLRFAAAWEEVVVVEVEEIEEVEEATVIALNPLLTQRPSRSSRRVEVDEAELTVARAVPAPRVLDDMVTRVASSARKPAPASAVRTVGGSQRSVSSPPARPIVTAQKPASSPPARPIVTAQKPASPSLARPIAASQKPASPSLARPIAASQKPASASPARPTAASQKPASASLARPVVASQKPASPSAATRTVAASSRPAIAPARPSSNEPVLVERLRQRAGMGRDEEVTLRFRHPRGSLRSAAS